MTTWAAFLTSGASLVFPLSLAAFFIAFVILRRGVVTWDHWARLARFESFLLPLFLGLAFGPKWLTAAINGMRSSELSVTVAGVMAGIVIVFGLLVAVIGVKTLSRSQGWEWVGVSLVGYNIGVWTNVILNKGEPFAGMMG